MLIHEDNQLRSLWRLGRIKEVIIGSDGQVRGTTLTVVTNGKQSTLRRPISCLYPLELDPKTSDVDDAPDDDKSQEVAQEDTPADDKSHEDARCSRPVRLATVKAQERLSKWVSDLTSELTDGI